MKRPLEGVDHTAEIARAKNLIEAAKKNQGNFEQVLTDLKNQEFVFPSLKKEYEEYERNKLRKEKNETRGCSNRN